MGNKSSFFCQNCGHETPKWLGKCPSCKEWNSIIEEINSPSNNNKAPGLSSESKKSVLIQEIKHESSPKIATKDLELNNVLGGGIVKGAVILLAGEPGIGKSTLMLQLALLSTSNILYVSGEEAMTQIKIRADRVGINNEKCHVYSETSTHKILNDCQNSALSEGPYELIIIDSIQTLNSPMIDSAAGSVSQIRQCCSELIKYAKETSTPIILIGHITKDGHIAGPKILEHMVDVVLNFEGDKAHLYRLLRAQKNRFGSTGNVGVYEMSEQGLSRVKNPSTILIDSNDNALEGTAIASTFEGQKIFLVEVQSLVSSAVYGTPQRSCTGFNVKRLHMLLAVLEKKCGFKLGIKDVFLNIAGGINVSDPSMDLAVIASILSSSENFHINSNTCFAGEVGLNGEIRPIKRMENHIYEAERVGFKKIYISSYNKLSNNVFKIDIIKCSKVEELHRLLLKD